jgi:hypothetical protein
LKEWRWLRPGRDADAGGPGRLTFFRGIGNVQEDIILCRQKPKRVISQRLRTSYRSLNLLISLSLCPILQQYSAKRLRENDARLESLACAYHGIGGSRTAASPSSA